ncbi:uncharacterized protein ACO6RY_04049 [Pungitius sinensis]
MAASMWRMSGPCRRMAAVLLLCALMLSTDVMCDDPAATNPTDTSTATNGTTANTYENLSVSTSVGGLFDGDSDNPSASTAPAGSEVKATSIPISSGAREASHTTDSPLSSGSSVFVGILVSGLLAALAITLGYLKCQRRTDTKGESLAEESYPVEQDTQGNTLVSVAPLNPPPETPEKPSVNGEAPEADKTEAPPPTNGHSTTKTADTEM